MTPNKDRRIPACGAGGIIGGPRVGALRRQGFTCLRAVDVKPHRHQWFDDIENLRLNLQEKAPDDSRLLEQPSFILKAFDVKRPPEADRQQSATTRIHKFSVTHSRAELAARNLFFVARKP